MRGAPSDVPSKLRRRQPWYARWWLWTLVALVAIVLLLLGRGVHRPHHEDDGILRDVLQRAGGGHPPKSAAPKEP